MSSSASVSVTPLTRSNLRAVMAIDRSVHPQPWTRRLWLNELGRDARAYRCAVDGGTVVGYSGAMFVLEDAHLLTLATHPGHQRRGIATRLLLDLADQAVQAGCEALTLEVRASNSAAQALYRRFGLAPVGWRRDYYAPDGEDAIVMWAHDIQADAYQQRLRAIASQVGVAA